MAVGAVPTEQSSEPLDPVDQIQAILDAEESADPGTESVRDAKGKFAPTPGGPKAKAEPKEEAKGEAEVAEEPEVAEEVSADAEETEEAEQEEAAAAEPEEDEGITTFAQLADSLEIDTEALAEHITIDGTDGKPVPLSDVISAYHNAPAATAQVQEYETKIHEVDNERAMMRNAHDTELNKVAVLTQQLLNALHGGEEPNWEKVRQQDPDNFLTLQRNWLASDEAIRTALSQLQNTSTERTASDKVEMDKLAIREANRLRSMVPEWRDVSKAKEGLSKVMGYLNKRGFSEDEVNGLVDHRVILVARDAMRYQELRAKRPKALARIKEVKKANKGRTVLRAKARQDGDKMAVTRSRETRARLKETGSVADAARAFEDMGLLED